MRYNQDEPGGRTSFMSLEHKTKIVATIGPASESVEALERMIEAGMNVARLNFSHGDFSAHEATIENIRVAVRSTEKRVAIMADLPGPKIRIGEFAEEPIELVDGAAFTLTTEDRVGDKHGVSVSLDLLPQAVKPGDKLFLSDGSIQLKTLAVKGRKIECEVMVGGELRSRKGLNLPGIDLGISAFTAHDHACLKFAAEQGVDAVSQSFVGSERDIEAVRSAANALGYDPFIIAKLERQSARDHLDAILNAADGIMIARGDLGVEIPIERIAVAQKLIMDKANRLGKPVITATQMLLSMVDRRRPTRAEATDVANAILDGTDCVMLSEESAMGKYPVESVAMLASIASATEPHRTNFRIKDALKTYARDGHASTVDLIALSVQLTLERVSPVAVIVPTRKGITARNIARFKLPVWITAFSPLDSTCQSLLFSYGVNPVYTKEELSEWNTFAREWLHSQGISQERAVLIQGPVEENPYGSHKMEILELAGNNDSYA